MYSSILRWAGSKRKLIPLLLEEMPVNYGRYVEPFCGSASLFFKVESEKAMLSDINEELINAWRQIRDFPKIREDLVALPKTKEFYYDLRSIDPSGLDERDRAIRFLYLNRFCFNGVYRTNMKGRFNVPRGTRTGDFPSQEAFDYASKRLSGSRLLSCDYKSTLRELQGDDFVYMDPPYALTNKFTGEYGVNSFSYGEIPQLIKMLYEIEAKGGRFLLSYVANESVIDLLSKDFVVKRLSVSRHVQGFKSNWGKSDEILVKNYV